MPAWQRQRQCPKEIHDEKTDTIPAHRQRASRTRIISHDARGAFSLRARHDGLTHKVDVTLATVEP